MLKDGLYEQIINQEILEQLARLDKDHYQITLDKLNADDARKLLTIYLSQVIRSGLHYLRDSFKSGQDKEALLAQIRLANSIVDQVAQHTKEADYQDLQILEKGEILTSIYQKMSRAQKISPIRPKTSLVENALFTGSKNEPSMLSEIKKEIASSDQVDLLHQVVRHPATFGRPDGFLPSWPPLAGDRDDLHPGHRLQGHLDPEPAAQCYRQD